MLTQIVLMNFKDLSSLLILISLLTLSCSSDPNVKLVKDENGRVLESFEVNDEGQKHGVFKTFNESGIITEEAEYANGKLNGYRRLYRPNGKIEIEEHYQQDVSHGPYTVYYESGAKEISTDYDQGKMNGILHRYFESGKIMEEVKMENNEENGPFKEYYENGNIQWEGTYLNGENEIGILKQFDEGGILTKKMLCDSLSICQTIWTKELGDIEPKNIFEK